MQYTKSSYNNLQDGSPRSFAQAMIKREYAGNAGAPVSEPAAMMLWRPGLIVAAAAGMTFRKQ